MGARPEMLRRPVSNSGVRVRKINRAALVTGPVIFISHSAKEAHASQALDRLVEELDAAGCDVRVDRRLTGGADWRAEISDYMAECDGAVLLFSSAALASGHVKDEVAILMDRRQRSVRRRDDPPLKIVPLLVDVTPDDLQASPIESSAIDSLHLLVWTRETPAKVLDEFGPLVSDAIERQLPDYMLRVHLAGLIQRLSAEMVRDIGEQVGLKPEDVRESGAKTLARVLLEISHDEQVRALSRLRTYDPELARTIYRCVAAYGLIDGKAADVVRTRARAPERERGLGINCVEGIVCGLYVKRADFSWQMLPVPRDWGDDVEGDILRSVRAELADELGYVREVPESSELNAALAEEGPVFLLLPDPIPGAGVVDAIRRELGNLVLLIRCATADALVERQGRCAEYVRPELADGEEGAVMSAHMTALRKLRVTEGDR